jgi:hypothetical protein
VDLEALAKQLAAAFKARGMNRHVELLRGYCTLTANTSRHGSGGAPAKLPRAM